MPTSQNRIAGAICKKEQMTTDQLMRPISSVFLAAIAIIITGGANAQPEPSVENGKKLAAQWCGECHVTGAQMSASDIGPTFQTIAATRSPGYLRRFLADPHARIDMPPFDLSREDIEDLVAYIESLQ